MAAISEKKACTSCLSNPIIQGVKPTDKRLQLMVLPLDS